MWIMPRLVRLKINIVRGWKRKRKAKSMPKKAKIVRDLSPRMRELLASDDPISWGENGLDKNREAFNDEERKIAGKIGTPGQGGTDNNRKR